MADFDFADHGSVILLRPLSDGATDWCDDNLPDAMWLGGAVAIEPRCFPDILEGIRDEGFNMLGREWADPAAIANLIGC